MMRGRNSRTDESFMQGNSQTDSRYKYVLEKLTIKILMVKIKRYVQRESTRKKKQH